MEASTGKSFFHQTWAELILHPASTVTGLASELTAGRQTLLDSQASLGVRAGCQLWERFFASAGGGEDVRLSTWNTMKDADSNLRTFRLSKSR